MRDAGSVAQPSLVARLEHDVRRLPWPVWDSVAALLLLVLVLQGGIGGASDWHYYDDAQRSLFGPDGLHVFARHPELQLGPLSMAVAWLLARLPGSGETWAAVVTAASLVPVLVMARQLVRDAGGAGRRAWVVGWLLVVLAWYPLVQIGQLGDGLVLVALLAAMLLVRRQRPELAAVALAVGAAFKPWAVFLLPLLLLVPRHRVRALAGAALIIGVVWLPFVVADPATLNADRLQFLVPSHAWQRLVGVGDVAPDLWRLLQLAVCWIVGLLVWWRAQRRDALGASIPVAAALIGLARLLSDIAPWPYYASVVLPLVWVADCAVRRRTPWSALLVALTVLDLGSAVGAWPATLLRCAALALAAALLVVPWWRSTRAPAAGDHVTA